MQGKDNIVAVITKNKNRVLFSGVPVFYAIDEKEMEKTALLLSKITMGMIHDLENECLVIVRH